jgi:hypothetical protein
VAELRPHIDEISSAASLAVIGNGGPSFARGFRERMDVPRLLILCDEPRTSYDLAAWRRSTALSKVPISLARYVRWFFKHPQTSVEGNALQLGGALVIRPGGEVTYRYRSEFGGDHPPSETLRDEALKAAGGGVKSRS